LINFENLNHIKMKKTFNFELAQLMPMVYNGNLLLNCEVNNFTKTLQKCSTTAVPSYFAYPQNGFDENFRLDVDIHDIPMKVTAYYLFILYVQVFKTDIFQILFTLNEYWSTLQHYMADCPFQTSDGWTFAVPNGPFHEAMAELIGLNREAFTPSINCPYLNSVSILVEFRALWPKVSHLIIAIMEIIQRLRLFPLMNNIMERFPLIMQNTELAARLDMDTANSLQYAILSYLDRNGSMPYTILEIERKVLLNTQGSDENIDHQFRYRAGRILPLMLDDCFNPDRVLIKEVLKTCFKPPGSSLLNENYFHLCWPKKWKEIKTKRLNASSQLPTFMDVTGLSSINSSLGNGQTQIDISNDAGL